MAARDGKAGTAPASGIASSLFQRLFQIEPEEQGTAQQMSALGLCILGAAFVVGRVVGTTLFLQRLDSSLVPYTYVLSALLCVCVSTLWASRANRHRRDHALTAVLAGLALLAGSARVALAVSGNSLFVLGGLYVAFDVFGDLALLIFWSLANDVYTSRQGKRVFGFIAAGGSLASVVFGALIRSCARGVGTENLLLLIVALALTGCWLARSIGRRNASVLSSAPKARDCRSTVAQPTLRADVARFLHTPYLLAVAALVSIVAILSPALDYQWKVSAAVAFQGNENGLASYFGSFFLLAGVATILLQSFLTSRLLRWVGVETALFVLPAILLVVVGGGSLALGASSFLVATAAKGTDSVLRFGIHDTALQVLYQPVPSRFRARAKAILEGMGKPLGTVFSGLAMVVLTPVLTRNKLIVLVVGAVVVWLLLVEWVRRCHGAALVEAVRSRRLDRDSGPLTVEGSAQHWLQRILESGTVRDYAGVLSLLEELPVLPWKVDLGNVLACSEVALQRRALLLVAKHGMSWHSESARAGLQASDPWLQAAALKAWCTLQREHALPLALPFARSSPPVLRAEAITGILLHGGIDGVLAVAADLKAMLADPDPGLRVAAARVLGNVGVRTFHQPLVTLMQDAEDSVRIAAVEAAGRVHNPALVPALLQCLKGSRTSQAALIALTRLGPSALDTIAEVFEEEALDPEIRSRIPRVLRAQACDRCVDLLRARLSDSSECVRDAVTQALASLAKARALDVPRSRIVEACEQEVCRGRELRRLRAALGSVEPALLGDALERRAKRIVGRILDLITVLYPDRFPDCCRERWEEWDRTQRADLLELVETSLEPALRRKVLDLLEADQSSTTIAPGLLAVEALQTLLQDSSDWVVACTLYEIGKRGCQEQTPDVLQRLDHPSPLVREEARRASLRLGRTTSPPQQTGLATLAQEGLG